MCGSPRLGGGQVGRTIARALRLNEDLVEAIALGHDLGHTPFAGAGEEALSVFTDEPFRHHEQSVRVVEVLERAGAGLNLTWEVREGILNHPWTMPPPSTPEGQAVGGEPHHHRAVTSRRAGLGLGRRATCGSGDRRAGQRRGVARRW